MTLACLCLFASHAGANSDIFKQVLPDGSVIYSDQPHPDATRIEPGQPQVIESFRPPPRPAPARREAPEEPEFRYEHLAISSPTEDEVIWDHQNTIDVTLALKPALKAEQGHRIVILMDGDVVTEATSGTRFTLTDAERFLAELDTVLTRGYAVDSEEEELGVRCIAVPVYGMAGGALAMSVSGPVSRLDERRIDTLVPHLRRIAAAASEGS